MVEEKQENSQKTKGYKVEPHLEVRPGDRAVNASMLKEFGFFSRMKKPFSVEKFPGSILLRSYRQGEVIFQQGQAGGTAFYIPTADDLARLKKLDAGETSSQEITVDPNRNRQILSAMIISSTSKTRPRGILERLFSPATKTKVSKVAAIPSDGPTDIDYETREAPLMEGDLFGEMSCISFSPRSATVIARVDCQLVEFTRSVFDKVREDPNHIAAVEEEYRRRTLETHLRQFELFRDLSESQIQTLKDNVSLEIVPPGKVICEEREPWIDSRPLDVFIVRNGIVQVSIHTSLSLHLDDILDWPALCRRLNDSQPDPKSSTSAATAIVPARKGVVPGTAAAAIPKPTTKPAEASTEMRVTAKLTESTQGPPADAIAENPPRAGSTPKKLSPIEAMRARNASAAVEGSGQQPPGAEQPPATPTAEASPETPAAPKKLSPIEAMRARNAAAAAQGSGQQPPMVEQTPVIPAAEAAAEAPTVPKTLSPIEAMRARNAAAAARSSEQQPLAVEPSPVTPTAEAPPEMAAAPKTLSPIEAMRARNAAAVAEGSEQQSLHAEQLPVTPPAEVSPETPAPSKKLSPIEAMRARNAAAAQVSGQPPLAVEQPSSSPAAETHAETGPSPKKLSPIEAMRARKSVESSTRESPPTASSPPISAVPSVTSPITPSAKTGGLKSETPERSKPSAESSQLPSPQKVPLLRKPRTDQSGGPVFLVKSWLSDQVQETVRKIACDELQDSTLIEGRQLVLDALNELLGTSDFLCNQRLVAEIYIHPELVRKTGTFPKGLKGIKDNWSELELRTTGRTAMSEIFPSIVRKPKESSAPPRVLAYLSRGDCFGEIAVVRREPRKATCIAYNHPSSEEVRDFGNVELVRIKGSAFRQLIDESPQLKKRVEELAAKRIREVQTSDSQQTETDLIASAEFQQMGLFQGTKLLVIDLDSCTRCGDCVDACVKTHDDGYARLFLDGPRYDRFLVPSACRNCLNPVCMIGCPVGSIGRGENGQIEIYDWCIGCSMCADQCPYDSIQMHDVGLIPEESMGWLYADSTQLMEDWYKSLRLSAGWKQGKSPFQWQGEFLRQLSTPPEKLLQANPLHLYFRHEFRLPKRSKPGRYRLSINDARRKGAIQKTRVKISKVIGVWLNGRKLELSGDSVDLAADNFVSNVNLLAIEVALDMPAEYGQFILSACLDAIPEAGKQAIDVLGKDVLPEMDLVTRRAAVCDMCSHIPSQQPACVSSCPHDAAIRINPLINFPR